MAIPILGHNSQNATPGPDRFDREYGGVHNRDGLARGDILDSEIEEIGKVFEWLEKRAGQRRDIDSFQREVKDQFHKIGFAVDVQWYTFAIDGHEVEGAVMPSIEIIGRVDKTVFDHDKKVHEVTNNFLELRGQDKGVVKSDWASATTPDGHQHR
ncbi:hypothetical protein [Kitasatospora viridis]|uniref:Uncharacterized protein n=1 Tax=Kitasatospora viridis TaxID=281105 RepID=A0A561SA75_9ACTN|nr:hypothetical protein [Kitasatospora viridis]TWF71776.1 hypothetical protein FHX73_18147 [Kitasatospora viridis]